MKINEIFENIGVYGNQDVTVALKAVNICMDGDCYDQSKLGRYGNTGYLYQIDNPTNPETGERTSNIAAGTIELLLSCPTSLFIAIEHNITPP